MLFTEKSFEMENNKGEFYSFIQTYVFTNELTQDYQRAENKLCYSLILQKWCLNKNIYQKQYKIEPKFYL